MTSTFAGRGRYAIYTGRSTNWFMVTLSGVLLVPLLVLGDSGRGGWRGLAVPLLVAAGAVVLHGLTAASVRTTAGPNGVMIRFGVLGWPRCRYPIARVARADVVDLPVWAVAYGFWWTHRRTCCTLRPGPTLRLTLHSGRTVTVTVPDPHAAATVIREALPA